LNYNQKYLQTSWEGRDLKFIHKRKKTHEDRPIREKGRSIGNLYKNSNLLLENVLIHYKENKSYKVKISEFEEIKSHHLTIFNNLSVHEYNEWNAKNCNFLDIDEDGKEEIFIIARRFSKTKFLIEFKLFAYKFIVNHNELVPISIDFENIITKSIFTLFSNK